ncbi:MAG: hypothetical protein K0B15_09925 [Lentimicrobium sp.]|nr:hypothetical protein [Lentimicrobium sp.]
MKKKILAFTLLFFLALAPSIMIFAQPNPGSGSGGGAVGGDPIAGGTAPIGGGMAILLVMGSLYAGKKVYNARVSEE